MSNFRMTPKQDRAVQAVFEGYVPAAELADARKHIAALENVSRALREEIQRLQERIAILTCERSGVDR